MLPKGPPTTPVLGNLLQMPPENLHLQLDKWAKECERFDFQDGPEHRTNKNLDGPIYSLKLGSQTQIVVSSESIIKDLLEKRSNNYSARMDMLLRQNSDDTNILFRRYFSLCTYLDEANHSDYIATMMVGDASGRCTTFD